MLNQTLADCLKAQAANPDETFLQVYEYICKTIVARYGRRMTETRIEDLTSHVTLYVLKNWWKYDPTQGVKPTTYAHRAMQWGIRNFFERREDKETRTFSELSDLNAGLIESPEAETEDYPTAAETVDRIFAVTTYIAANATPRQLSIFELRIKGYTAAEIAAELEISPQAVSTHLSRVRQLAHQWEQGELSAD